MSTDRTAVVIPTLGASTLRECCEAVVAQDPPAQRVLVVASGSAAEDVLAPGCDVLRHRRRLGFAAATDLGLAEILEDHERVAVLNDDAVPQPHWLATLGAALSSDERLAAVQGTVGDASGRRVDGRGITFDRYGVPVQVDRHRPVEPEESVTRRVLAVSCTAALLRCRALREAWIRGGQGSRHSVFDPAFGSYHEDLDLGLRLCRLGWRSAWVGGAPCRHVGSATGVGMRWRHPWWILVNRWRVLAGNLSGRAVLAALPRLLRGELRSVGTLTRSNPRAFPVGVAVMLVAPLVVRAALARATPGPRLDALPGAEP